MAENWTPRIKRLLSEAGCYFVRQGRGDHEIWHSPKTGRFMMDNKIKTRRWALERIPIEWNISGVCEVVGAFVG
jgi:hypothetical protein